MSDEPLLTEDNSRFIQLPIKYPEMQKMYDIAESSFWTSKEIDYIADISDWNTLTSNERVFIEHILAFFATADGIVLENLVRNFCDEVKVVEARNFYAFQAMIENVHAMTYANLIETFVKDVSRKEYLFNAIEEIPCVKRKADWALKWLDTLRPFAERIIAFSVVEGIFFSGAFCAIFWLKSRNKMSKALGKSNELIARDESLHTEFAILMYKYLKRKVDKSRVVEIIKEAVEIEKDFICVSLPCKLIGMNSALMSQYIEYVADRLIVQLGYEKIYNMSNPFDFMKMINLDGKTNFFESKVSEYSKANINEQIFDFTTNDDF